MPKTIIIFFGPPGSGKGTQAQMLAQKTEWKKISTGDLFRAEIAAGTEAGKLADKYIKAGKLVPDKIVFGLVEKSLKQKTAGFIFDGFPRNKKQLNELLAFFKKILKKNDQVYALEVAVSDEEIKQRLSQRRMCACGKVYHLVYNPPINKDICDICGGRLFIRNDDKPKVITHRLKIYHSQSKFMTDYWQKQGRLIKIDGEQPIKKIHEEIMEKLSELKLI
ncbi:MAG: nucleoside monophosphate kinase [Parcubacteria group bacterium]|nr:nucleoside monophosphate kinase [Parcubacteria group bacterium]